MNQLNASGGASHRPPFSARLVHSRPAIFSGFVVLSIIVAGSYGILHNQLSYTVSPEYFTEFKFLQFGLTDLPEPERFKASVVGFLASWWMGIPVGILVGAGGFLQRDPREMRRALLWSLVVLVSVTLLVGLAGLVSAFVTSIELEKVERWSRFVPEGVNDVRAFMCAGWMHNASYLGGVLGIPAAWLLHLCWRYGRSNK